jgi:hypothetical protein
MVYNSLLEPQPLAPCISNRSLCVRIVPAFLIRELITVLILCIGVGTGNNYAYLVTDDKSKDAFVIDPAHPEEYV